MTPTGDWTGDIVYPTALIDRDTIRRMAGHFVAFVSNVFTLEPGDLILTGTPPGVGWARDPKVSLRPGDTVEVEVEGIGVLSNPVVAEA